MAAKPKVRPWGERIGGGVGTKFCVLTWRGLLASARAVAIKKETTRWQRDRRSRMTS